MKIFFQASLLGKYKYLKEYKIILKIIKKLGHEVYSDHIMKKDPEYLQKLGRREHKQLFLERQQEIKKSDAIIAETTIGSVGVGHVITLALGMHKSVLVLHRFKPHGFLLGNPNRLLIAQKYSVETQKDIKKLTQIIKTFLKKSEKQILRKRFNLMINAEQENYLKRVSKNQGISKANFIRQLINKNMDEDKKGGVK